MTGIIPIKTPDGHDELARRTRRLGQRHRTVLLLVDGRRSVEEVIALAGSAGAGEEHYRELLAMGLVGLPDGAPIEPAVPGPPDDDGSHEADTDANGDSASQVELPPAGYPAESARAVEPVPAVAPPTHFPPCEPAPPVSDSELVLPSAQSLLPDSSLSDFDRLDDLSRRYDAPFEEARQILLRAVRTESPVAGRLTLMKIKRARGRAELEALLAEVEGRIARPRKKIVAAQTLSHVRHLLRMPASTSFTMY